MSEDSERLPETDGFEAHLLALWQERYPNVGLRDPVKAIRSAGPSEKLTGIQHTLACLGFSLDCKLPPAVAMRWRSQTYPRHVEALDEWRRFIEEAAAGAEQAKNKTLADNWADMVAFVAEAKRKYHLEPPTYTQFRTVRRLDFWHTVANQLLRDLEADSGRLAAALAISGQLTQLQKNEEASAFQKPRWDSESRELWFGDQLCKRFRQKAEHQTLILDSFQELGWPTRIDDPLPGGSGSKRRQQLSDAVRRLNSNSLICFELDGTTTGIIWRPAKSAHAAPMQRP